MPTSKDLDGNARAKKKSAPSMKPSRTAPPPASFKSAEYVQESDNDEPAISKGNKTNSDEESLRSSPTDVMVTSNGKLQRPAGSGSTSENDSESDEDGTEVNDEEEEDLIIAAKENPVVPVK